MLEDKGIKKLVYSKFLRAVIILIDIMNFKTVKYAAIY